MPDIALQSPAAALRESKAPSMAMSLVGLACALAACGDNFHPDVEPRAIRIEPADAMVSVVNGAAVAKTYTATLIDANGGERDVTEEATFSLGNARYGSIQGATVTVTGQGAGPTRVIASHGEITGDTGLIVFVKDTIVDPDVDPAAPQRFDGATEDASLVPEVAYPPEGSLLPPNLGQFDVHWRQPTANVFEIKLSNTYIDIKRYTNGDDPSQPYWTVFELAQWYPIATAREQLAIDVAGMNTADPTKKGRSPTRKIDVTNEDAQGGIYYWTTSGLAGIWRYDLSKNRPGIPLVPPVPYFADDQRPASCMGCHTLSRDGTKIAMTFLDGAGFRGTVFDVASRAPLIPFDGTTQPPLSWYFATFNAQATRLVTIEGTQMYLRTVDGALLGGPLPAVAGGMATHPDLSPDNKRLANIEFTGGDPSMAYGGSLVVRSYDDAAGTFGAPTVLVAASAGVTNAYPSFSPDGQWIAFTRTVDHSYDHPTAETWVVKADGSRPPIRLTLSNNNANLTNSWARWMPSELTFGPQSNRIFYLTFSSKREFGTRIPAVGRPQIWVTPFHINKAENGQDPSGPAFRLPFQDVLTANHIAQWTTAVVGQ
jgi:hypothetical protein